MRKNSILVIGSPVKSVECNGLIGESACRNYCKDLKLYKLTKIACLSVRLLRCINGRIQRSMQPLMRLEYERKSGAISINLFRSQS
jgi:hypothetical protein